MRWGFLFIALVLIAFGFTQETSVAQTTTEIKKTSSTIFENAKLLCERLRKTNIPVGSWKCFRGAPICSCISSYITFGDYSTIAYYVYGNPKGQVDRILIDVFIFKPDDWDKGYPLLVQGLRRVLKVLGVTPQKELFQAIHARQKGSFKLKSYIIQLSPEKAKRGSAFKVVILPAKEI